MLLPLLSHVRAVALLLALAASASLAACAAPSPPEAPAKSDQAAPAATGQPAAGEAAVAQASPPPAPVRKDVPFNRRTGGPLPPERVDDPKLPPEIKVDSACRTDADCTVKNVGNCCGQYPACVNINSPTDPEGVQARCAKSGMAAVCGFQEISGCSCVKGTCQAAGGVEEVAR